MDKIKNHQNIKYVKMAVLPYCLPPIETGSQCAAIKQKYNTLFPPAPLGIPAGCPDYYPTTVTPYDVLNPL